MESLVRQQYDRLADIYDNRWRTYITNTLSFLVDWANIPSSAHVLDIACGTGELERLLTTKNTQQSITGIDISSRMLAIAQQKCAAFPNVSFRQASALSLPWQKPRFQVVVCANAFHYFDSPTEALLGMKQVLYPNGKVIILDWCRDFVVCQFCDWILGWVDSAHKRCYTEAELHSFVRLTGLKIQRSQRVRFGLIWGLMVVEATYSAESKAI